jgi:hypothetical protein
MRRLAKSQKVFRRWKRPQLSGEKLGPIFYRIADGTQGPSGIKPSRPKLIRSSLKQNGRAITDFLCDQMKF